MPNGAGDKTSLVLTGGGGYAAYEVGVMRALFNGETSTTNFEPFDPDLLIGTSAGAMNVAALAAAEVRTGNLIQAVDELRSAWLTVIAEGPDRCGNGVFRLRGFPTPLLDPNCLRGGPVPLLQELAADTANLMLEGVSMLSRMLEPNDSLVRRLAGSIDLTAVIETNPFQDTLKALIPLDDVARSTRKMRIVALDISTGLIQLFTEEDLRRLGYLPLLASTAIPAFFRPLSIDGHYFINGSTLATTPLLPAIAESDTMHIVYMDPDIRSIDRIRLQNFIDVIDRVMIVNFAYAMNRDLQLASEINLALELMDETTLARDLTRLELHAVLRAMGRIERRVNESRPYRKLTIHRYHPRDDLGGDLGLMNLTQQRIGELIDRGYRDAVEHDCSASGCLIPNKPTQGPFPSNVDHEQNTAGALA